MNWELLTNSKLVEPLGWTLIHSIWQIAFVAGVLFLILRAFQNVSSNARYSFSISALGLAFALPCATFVLLFNQSVSYEKNNIPAAENAKSVKASPERAGSFEVVNGDQTQAADSPVKNNYFPFEQLQGNFKDNLASFLPALVWLWLFGVLICAIRLSGGVWQLRQYKTREITEPDELWLERFSSLCERLRITQAVRLRASGLVKTPMVVGCLKPLILIPAGVFLQIDPRELETILAHELVHVRRRDNLVNFLQSFVEILFFYHPCAWWVSAVIRREREFACDDAVLETLDARRLVYAEALANLEELRLSANEKTPPLIVAASGGKLMKRIERIIEKNTEMRRSSPKQSFWSASLALLLISAVLICVFSAQNRFSVNAKNEIKDKKMAIGFVSLPPVDRINPPRDADATARLLIEKLKSRRIPAIGFVQGSMILDTERAYLPQTQNSIETVRADIVRLWRDAELEIGVGGFRHIWFYDTPYENYAANFEKNLATVKQITGEKNTPVAFFSYPFLNTGKTTEDHRRFEALLKSKGLRSVKYTFDNQEWMYSYAYDVARKDNDANRMREIRADFLEYMTKMLAHYEAYSNEMFGRDIAQTLVLTPSRLVADTSDGLFGIFEKSGYEFVSMEEAQSNEAYKTPDNFAGKAGISWFDRWALAQNKKPREEPEVSPAVEKIWNDRRNTK